MEEKRINKDKKTIRILKYVLLSLVVISAILLFISSLLKTKDLVNRNEEIIKSILILVFSILFLLSNIRKSNKNFVVTSLASLVLIGYCLFGFGIRNNFIDVPNQERIGNLTNKTLTEVMKWSSSKKIKLEQTFETSDSIEEYRVISQDVDSDELVKNVDKVKVVISSGPNYDKEIVLPSFIGKNVDDIIKFVEENYLLNVNIDFIENDQERDTILSQDKNGQVRRNDTINFVASIGSYSELGDVNFIDLVNQDTFHAVTWLKRNGFKYALEYEYSDTVKKGLVISQSVEEGSTVPYTTNIKLVISKGPKIKVPNLKNMEVSELTEWIISNNLKVVFEETYDESVEMGKIVSVSVNENDEIEQGTLIKVTISQGQLKLPEFKKATDLRNWAEKYGIEVNQTYEFNDQYANGEIIKCSKNVGDVIKNNEVISITVSQGKSITVPNFVGKSKSDIQKLCNSNSLRCTFSYGDFSDTVGKDIATYQNKRSGSKVVSGTSVNITLSKGKANSYQVTIMPEWIAPGNPDGTISTLNSKLSALCPGVKFNFVKKAVNNGVGTIVGISPTSAQVSTGYQTLRFKEGQTYTFYIGRS